MRRVLLGLAFVVTLVVVFATYVTPWPSILVIRFVFDRGAARAAEALASRVPTDAMAVVAMPYSPGDDNARFDIYRGSTVADGPTIIWFHGGGFVSGRRQDVGNYLRILAGRGFPVVNADYTIAPEATYPTPIVQANQLLAYLKTNSESLGINPDRWVLAGDSAGAQIAAQTAAMVTNPAYASVLGIRPGVQPSQIAGVLLYCGVYDVTHMGEGGGVLGWFVHSTGWAYSGRRDWRQSGTLESMVLGPYLTPSFPPAFISAGNADPLGSQSVVMAGKLAAQQVPVTELFFPADYRPPLQHEYQFNLDTDAGAMALERSVRWLSELRK